MKSISPSLLLNQPLIGFQGHMAVNIELNQVVLLFVKSGIVCFWLFFDYTVMSLLEVPIETHLKLVLWTSKHYATCWWKPPRR